MDTDFRARGARTITRLERSRHRRAGKAVDRHGAALHTFVTILTVDPALTGTLLITAFTARSTAIDGEVGGLRKDLAGAAYSAWSCHPTAPGRRMELPQSSAMQEVHQLPDDHRAALALCLFGDHTHTQTAAAMGLPGPTVVTLLREALMMLAATKPEVSVAGRPAD